MAVGKCEGLPARLFGAGGWKTRKMATKLLVRPGFIGDGGTKALSFQHALLAQPARGNPPPDRHCPARGPAREADPQGPGILGLLSFSPGKVALLQGRECQAHL